MQRWEYCEVRETDAVFYRLSGEERVVFYNPAERGVQWQSRRVVSIARLGMDGWGAVAGSGEGGLGAILFKRPI